MDWPPTSEEEIWDEINSACIDMTRNQERLWDFIMIMPEKWQQDPWGKESGGFWAAAVFGNQVIWYNDIEKGFNRSCFTKQGVMDQYWCNETPLAETIMWLETELKEGRRTGYISSGPFPGPAPGHPESFDGDD